MKKSVKKKSNKEGSLGKKVRKSNGNFNRNILAVID